MIENKNILLILVIAIIVAVSASFSNNFFAYYFLSQEMHTISKKDGKKISNSTQSKHIKINKSWSWHYSDIGIEDNNYPIIALRDGYKAIKIVEDKVLMGLNYELLNTSPKRKYIVTINYKLEDTDGFLVNESSSTGIAQPKDIAIIKNTTYVHCDDYNRITGASWSIQLTPDWGTENLNGNRFERAGVILKEKSPYWLKTYLTYLFMNELPSKGTDKGLFQTLFPNKWIIAQALDIKPEPMLIEIGKKLNLDFTKYDLPSWNKIISNPNYASLGEKEKEILKKFLSAQKDYGDYSPDNGRENVWEIVNEFPEPTKPMKETK